MKASSVQDAFRAIPERISGVDASEMLHDYASQLRAATKKAPDSHWYNPLSWGQQTYGIDTALKAADEIDSAATRFRLYSVISNPSADYNELKLFVGRAVQEMYGLQGQIEVFNSAKEGLVNDLISNAKNAADIGGDTFKWVIVGIAAVTVLVLVFRFGGSNA